jgi:quinoprotein glucose dehydrogenase
VYLFDRFTGKPLFPIEYHKYPASDMPGEVTAETQPLPKKPAPFSRQTFTEESLTNRNPEVRRWALEQFRTMNQRGGQFVPFKAGQEPSFFPASMAAPNGAGQPLIETGATVC